ncbi:PTS system mannose/fructose/sorbose family transporter subunit IID [Anaerorhabdus sp.]|uniref:PTS system mannose/fructose/sorbose family transporter subunit IID n=1 Tax=Anaerorhabdus sp. TaxID=1872524 RepID=UPI002FCBD960
MTLTAKTLKRTFWRSFPLQGCFNYERQQTVGWLYSLVPGLQEIYHDDPEGFKEALTRHTGFYNTSPQMTCFIQGVVLAMEEEKHRNPDMDGDSIAAVRTALIGPLAGIGDGLFWGTLRTVGLGIGVAMALEGNYLGPVIFWLIHNIPHFLVRKYGLKLGYEQGMNFLSGAMGNGAIEEVTAGAKIVGSVVVGAMISSMVKVTTSITFSFGSVSYAIQSLFDTLMPNMLPLLVTFGCYYLMKKGVSTTKVMFLLIGLAIVLVLLESLPFLAPVVVG